MILDKTGKWRLEGRYWVRLSDDYRLPVIQGSGPAVTVQNDKYAFGDDDGPENTHTLDSENTNRSSQSADETFMIRIQIEETNGGNESAGYALFAQKNGVSGWTEVTTSRTDGIIIADDVSSRSDDESTSERLSYGGTSSFAAGKYDDGQTQQGTTTISLDQDTNGYTDLEFAIQIDSANAINGDFWNLAVYFNTGTALDGYPGSYPRVTASISATPQISESDGITLGESQTTTPLVLPDLSETDAITIGDTLVNLTVSSGAPADNDISETDGMTIGDAPVIDPLVCELSKTEGITIGDSPSMVMSDLILSVSDGITVGESVNASIPGPAGQPIPIDLGVDNYSAWVQGVRITA